MSVYLLKPWPKPEHMILLRFDDGPELTYEPAEDITAYEAALNGRFLACVQSGLSHMKEFFNDMPESARRHWVPIHSEAAGGEE